MDLEIYVTNEEIFLAILGAERKYFSVMYSFLTKSQIRGKSLKAMGVENTMGEMPNVSKILPLIYKRKIKEPKQKWVIRLLQNSFSHAICVAEHFGCVGHNKGSLSCFESKNLETNMYHLFNRNDGEEIGESSVISTQRDQNSDKSSNKSDSSKEDIEIAMLSKISETQQQILWPFKTLNTYQNKSSGMQELDPITFITNSSTKKSSESIKVISFCNDIKVMRKEKYTKITETKITHQDKLDEETLANANKENYLIQKKIVHTTEKLVKNFALTTFKENANADKAEETGFLTDLFSPASKQPLFPENITPMILGSGTTDTENSRVAPQ